MIHNSATDYPISVKFGTKSNHVTSDLQPTFKVKGSNVKVTA